METTTISTKTIEIGLNGYKDQLDKIISREKLIKEIGFAAQAVNSNNKLQQCTQVSIFKAVYNVALTGLSLNPIKKESAMVPKFINGQYEAVLFPMYQGISKLITDSGAVTSIMTAVVHEGDEFEYELGLHVDIKHKPKGKSKNIIAAYAIARLFDGSVMVEVMDEETSNYIRECSETWKAYLLGKIKEEDVIWSKWKGEMCRKSVVKRLCKSLPKTERFERLQEAINLDDEEYTISHNQQDYLFSLIQNSTFDDDMKNILERKVMAGLNHVEFENMKNELMYNQLNAVTEKGMYSQKELSSHLKKISSDNRKQNSNLFNNEEGN